MPVDRHDVRGRVRVRRQQPAIILNGTKQDIQMHQLPFTALLNHLFAGPVTALLTALGVHPAHPAAPIPDHVAMQILVFIVLIVFFVAVRASLSVDKPNTLQHIMEGIYNFMDAQSAEIIGHDNKTLPLVSDHAGAVHSLLQPAGADSILRDSDRRAGGAAGLRRGDLVLLPDARLTHQRTWDISSTSCGPVWWLAPLMFVIEVCSHLARMLSLTVRLFANMFAGDMVTLVFFSLVPIGVPVVFMGLHFGVSLIQTYIFVLLAMVYLGEATAHEH